MFRQEELAGRRHVLLDRSRLGMIMQPVGSQAARLALDRDAITVAAGRVGDAVVALDRWMAGDFQPEGEILASPVAHDRTAIFGFEDERGDDAAFGVAFRHPEVAPAGPAARCRFGLVISAEKRRGGKGW